MDKFFEGQTVERVDSTPFGEGGRAVGMVVREVGAMVLVQYENESNTTSFTEMHQEELMEV